VEIIAYAYMPSSTTEFLVYFSIKELYAIVLAIIGYTFLLLQSYFKITATIRALAKALEIQAEDIRVLELKVRDLELASAKNHTK
jgi:hypothetical protein